MEAVNMAVMRIILCIFLLGFLLNTAAAQAQANNAPIAKTPLHAQSKQASPRQTPSNMTTTQYRDYEEQKAQSNPFGIALYQPNYFLPFYYMTNPDDTVYRPSDSLQSIDRIETKFQFS